MNRFVLPYGSQATSCTRHLSGHSFVVPIITIHASASKPVQCGNWLTTLARDSQSLIHRINFETCGTATHWSGLFLLDLGTIQVRFEAIIGSFLVQFPKMPKCRTLTQMLWASAIQKSSASKAIAFESGAKCPCQRNRVRSQAGSDLLRRGTDSRWRAGDDINRGATFQVAVRATEITRPPRSRRQARGKVVRSAARPSPRRNFAPSRAPSVFPTTRDREKSPAHA